MFILMLNLCVFNVLWLVSWAIIVNIFKSFGQNYTGNGLKINLPWEIVVGANNVNPKIALFTGL